MAPTTPRAMRKFRAGYQFGLVILVFVSLLSIKQIYDYSRFVAAIRQGDEVRNETSQLELRLREAEAHHISFVVTGRKNFADRYNVAVRAFATTAKRLAPLVNAMQVPGASASDLIGVINRKVDYMNETMRIRASGRLPEAQQRLSSEDSIALSNSIQQELEKLDQSFKGTRFQNKDSQDSALGILFTIASGTLFALGLLFVNRKVSLREAEDFRNLSQILAERQAELVRLNEAAKVSSQAKSDFLANISHEVRTPLNAISGLSQILLRSGVPPEQKKLIEAIRQSSQSLLDVINPVLDISKIEHEGLKLDLSDSVDLGDLAERSVNIMTGQAEIKKIELRLNLMENLGFVETDATRLKQVFLNLLGNAIKFTEKGFVEFRATIIGRSESERRYRFEIIDSGIGIPDESKEKLFQSFTQSDNSISRKYGGTGLGLSISKAIVEKMGGQIGFHSQLGKGTTFWFEITCPVAKGPPRTVQKDEIFSVSQDYSHVRALIVEDNPMNQFVLKNFLADFQCHAEVVSSGQEAIERMWKESFDIIFLDVQMPGMDGFTATQHIRQIEASRSLKGGLETKASVIVATTAHVMSGYRDKCLQAGMNDYLSKPIQMEALGEILGRHFASEVSNPVSIKKPARPVKPPPPPVASSESNNVVAIDEKRWERLAKSSHLKEMIEIYLTSTPEKFAELATAVIHEKWEDVREIAHFLKSSCSSLGLNNLTELCAELEELADGACTSGVLEDASRLVELQNEIFLANEKIQSRLLAAG